MKVLLSDGSGLTARECATRLAASGHVVDVLTPDPLCLCRFTRHVARLHLAPPYGADPLRWLDAAVDVYRSGRFDVLFPTQEQVAVLSRGKCRLDTAGVATVVPPFAALSAVQDKIAAWRTLRRLGIPQPESSTEAEGWDRFPAFVKDPIGTASGGVRQVADRTELDRAATERTVLVQAAVDGPLAMCQSVFDAGSLVAFHANERTAEGASHKRSISLPEVRRYFEILGQDLHWHGALSADVVLGYDGPFFIDVNPRLVEPQNAYLSGVDLVGSMMELATGGHPTVQAEGTTGVATHQLLLAVLGAAQDGRGRRGVLAEVLQAASSSRAYLGSSEELTPLHRDLRSIVPVALAAAATFAAPTSFSWFAAGSVANYALSEPGWQDILHTDLSAQHFDRPLQPTGLGDGAQSKARPGEPDGRAHGRPARARIGEARRQTPLRRPARQVVPPTILARRLDCFAPRRRSGCHRSHLRPRRRPRPRASAIARTKLIDDLVEEIAPTVEQVVLLGAGYDTRPYRLSCLASPRVFEVDHPATQTAKRATLSRAGVNTSGVVFVGVDFETDDLAGALRNARYAADKPTLFVWEGVTQYLSAEAVDNTLAVVHKIALLGAA